ncbi:MAG TPA: hypothetical protein VFU59_07585 [Candidatus Eisenbacteria bacterium]|nr:hypothetical protein [Candidatus Eisenbacteria bacterium]
MRRSHAAPPAPLVPFLAAVAGVALLAGCGDSKETGSARERDEARSYGRVVVRSEATPRRVTLGDPVVWTLTASLPPSAAPSAVLLDSVPPALDIAPKGEPTLRNTRGGVTWSRRYDVKGFDLGAIALPGARLSVRVASPDGAAFPDTLAFPPDSIAVDSLTPAATGATAPDRGPIDPGLRPIDWAVAGVVALVVAILLVLLVRRWNRRRARPDVVEPVEPPEPRFARALESLRAEGPTLARDAFHERLSDAIRRYVGDVTGIDTIDLTTRELDREMKRSARTRPEAAAEIVRILRRSDLVKFARRADAWDEARALLEDAAKLSGTVAVAAPPSSAPAAPGTPGAPPPTATPTEGNA